MLQLLKVSARHGAMALGALAAAWVATTAVAQVAPAPSAAAPASAAPAAVAPAPAAAPGAAQAPAAVPFQVRPSFDCSKRLNSAQRMICADAVLSGLDAKLGQIFSDIWRRMPQDKSAAYFAAEQRDWTQSRDGCPQTGNPTSCLSSVYRTRIAELQGRFGLVPSRGPFRFTCEGSPPSTVVVTWFETDPPSGQVETADGATTVFSVMSASGARYIGNDMQVWEHQGELTVSYATRNLELSCRLPKAG